MPLRVLSKQNSQKRESREMSKAFGMVWKALSQVLSRPSYAAMAVVSALLLSAAELLIGSYRLILTLPNTTGAGVGAQLLLTRDLLLGSAASHGWWGVVGVLTTSVLLGIIISLTIYVWRHVRTRATGAVSLASGGSLAAILGLTFLACGPLLFGSFFAAIGATGVLLALPFHGAEFTLLALALLLFAVYALSRVITAPRVCRPSS